MTREPSHRLTAILARLSLPVRCQAIAVAAAALLAPAIVRADQATDDVLRSISQNVGKTGESSTHLLPIFMVIVGVIVLIAWFGSRQRSPRKPKPINHSRKLLRQMSRQLGLAGTDVKQLKLLADAQERASGQKMINPLTLLLCPSLINKAVQESDARVDRQAIVRMLRRVGTNK